MSKSPKSASHSTTSWTIPKPADVLSYSYLWTHEAERGEDEGRKDRPVVIVIAQKVVGDRTELMAVPITTQPPRRTTDGFEVPQRVKAHLGLDAKRCWIMVTELNRFLWPGPDVRPIRRGKELTPFYGALPEKLFRQVLEAVIKQAEAGSLKAARRSE